MRKKINPYHLSIENRGKLIEKDLDIGSIYKLLAERKYCDICFLPEYNKLINSISDSKVKDMLMLGKIVYCMEYQPYIFLFIGIAIEKLLNNVAQLYIDNGWPCFKNLDYNKKIIDTPLGIKQSTIISYNLFNDNSANTMISSELQAITPLRNFGSHDKYSLFLNMFFSEISNIDDEIKRSISLMKKILIATDALIKNPPK